MAHHSRMSCACPTTSQTRKQLHRWNLLILPLLAQPRRCHRNCFNRLNLCDSRPIVIVIRTLIYRPQRAPTLTASHHQYCQMFTPDPILLQRSHALNLTLVWHIHQAVAWAITQLSKQELRRSTSKLTQTHYFDVFSDSVIVTQSPHS
jgi:hypothetical protein